ncbi:DUF1015 domain-containing protein [Tuwongella immobilis]|uniref:DUF1015 domain-containing protein n=1 Tax=Tuwongella immobilis TaxID=692036 RepID=A0A6C2YKU3_9BACT|nr:DUF1015 domain-containing protein [Tuwongella immobilis]VIP01997.1 Uncharacterized protein OS=Singulisphaera acidiphila (strain ATCC BAA-1392 / DSM 18658 / VKM B-2454 / MOB10) GN=Sinac_1570 PE=4 SV=1: DUF1015 [Tuwongella immobilis]VTS00078.1 Uncharacterized protein OS=Singulisphaera acidiphila (strain ATCC BAA-1392 / DSM 18658 / VKM B-2454 / MOB10) GN=Sinac_1570 PE=4 SV=1: DUF1015 [Tuwongella immobilis]
MAEIHAFRAVRYDLGRVGMLSDVVAPPYDVIDAALQQQLYDRSPFNSIRVELTQEQPGDTEHNNRYTRAASTIREWEREGALVQDSVRALYVYEQEFVVEGKTYHRRGFIGRVRLEPFGTGRIFPHEETMSGPKADRLNLYRATAMNLSPVFGLYPDETNAVFAILEPHLHRNLPVQAVDHLGVVSRIWTITDETAIREVSVLFAEKPVFIADGHHRYETSLKYLEERKAAGEVTTPDASANFVMMMLVSMSDPGLIILPTHRLVSGLSGLTSEQVKTILAPEFDVETIGVGADAAKATWERMEMDGGQTLLGFGTTSDGVWQLAKLRNGDSMNQLAGDHSDPWRELGVSVLHVLVLNHLVPQAIAGASPTCKYVHLLQEVTDAQAAGACDLAVLVPPAGMEHVELIAGNREKMPPKSTYFYPKLLTGLTFNTLKGN